MNWNLISEGLPVEKQEVLLHWPVPDMPPIYRLGSLFYKPFDGDQPIWKFDLDCGDASAMIFSRRDDEQPTHWAPLVSPKASDAPASVFPPASAVEAGGAGKDGEGK